MIEFCSLFSGSSGNSLFVKSGSTRFLVDAGKNGRKVQKALAGIGQEAKDLDGILITHEHTDHISAAGVLSRRFDLPIYANGKTWEAIYNGRFNIGKLKPENIRLFENDPFVLGDLQIKAFETSHDAAAPVGFTIDDGKSRLGIATDTGIITPGMKQELPGCKLVVLESNHDTGMLETGPYPYHLKRRIAGEFGHLDNQTSAGFACDLVRGGTEHIVLAHLSRENNLPYLCYQTAENVLSSQQIKVKSDVNLEIAGRDKLGQLHTL